jgi:hypothetical protein
MALMLAVGVALPNVIGWWVEYRSKAQFLLRSRGIALHLRSRSVARCGAWLRARGLLEGAPAGGWPAAAPGLAAGGALLLWRLADLLVASTSRACRSVCA